MQLYIAYQVRDLFYSWYLILKVGGSGWELMSANELPGWEKYEAQRKQEQKKNLDIDDDGEGDGDLEMNQGDGPNNTENSQADIMQLLRMLQGGGGSGQADGQGQNPNVALENLMRQLGGSTDEETQPMITPLQINAE